MTPPAASGARSRPGGRLAPYAWLILGQSFVTMAVVFGIWFSFAVFFVAMVEEFHWGRGDAALAFSVGSLVQALLSPVVGWLADRLGPRLLIAGGLGLSAVGLAACSLVQSLWQLVVLFGIGVGSSGVLAGMVTHAALLAAWFVHRRGMIIGFSFAGMGLGVKVISPLAQHLILLTGWRQTFLLLAGGVASYALFVALTLRNSPREVGLQPYEGGEASRPSLPASAAVRRWSGQAWTVRQALRTREFWALSLAQLLIPMGIFPISVHQIAYLTDVGFTKTLAAAILGHMGLMSSCGRILFGALSDRLGRLAGVTISILCSQAGILILMSIDSPTLVWPLYLYALFFGLGFGARGPIISAITADLFAGKHFGAIFGLISLGHGIGSALGPWFGGYVYDHYGSYRLAFLLALLTLAGVVACVWIATRPLPAAAATAVDEG